MTLDDCIDLMYGSLSDKNAEERMRLDAITRKKTLYYGFMMWMLLLGGRSIHGLLTSKL